MWRYNYTPRDWQILVTWYVTSRSNVSRDWSDFRCSSVLRYTDMCHPYKYLVVTADWWADAGQHWIDSHPSYSLEYCRPIEKFVMVCLYFRHLHKTTTSVFTMPFAFKAAKFHVSTMIITEVSIFGYVIYFSAEVCISWKINNAAKLANSANTGPREMKFISLGGGEYGNTLVLVCWRYLKYLRRRSQFSFERYILPHTTKYLL